jgi:hypothetical protein
MNIRHCLGCQAGGKDKNYPRTQHDDIGHKLFPIFRRRYTGFCVPAL